MKTVFHVICRPDGGGAEFLVRELVRILPNYGYKTFAIYFYNPTKVKLRENEICLNLSSARSIKAIFSLRKTLKKLNFNEKSILHTHLTWPLYYCSFAFPNIRNKFHTEHNTSNKRRRFSLLKLLEKKIYSKNKIIICISNAVKKSLSNWIEDKNQRLITISNGIRIFPLKKQIRSNPNKVRLISIGSLTDKKGFDIALNAISKLGDLIESYIILGEGPLRKKLEKLVSKYSLNKIVKMPGHVEDVFSYINNADLCIMPSRVEGFGLAALEVLSAGLPLIASNVEGLKDISNSDNTILFKSEDIYSLRNSIILASKKLVGNKKLAKSGREHALSFSLEKMAKNYADVYDKIL